MRHRRAGHGLDGSRSRATRPPAGRELLRVLPRLARERADLQPGERADEGRLRAPLRGAHPGRPGKSHQSVRDISLLGALPGHDDRPAGQLGGDARTPALGRRGGRGERRDPARDRPVAAPDSSVRPANRAGSRTASARGGGRGSPRVRAGHAPRGADRARSSSPRRARARRGEHAVAQPLRRRLAATSSPLTSTSSSSRTTRRSAASADGLRRELDGHATSPSSASRAGRHAGRRPRPSAQHGLDGRRSPTGSRCGLAAPGPTVSSKDVWLVLPDQLSTRLFVDTGIVDGLRDPARRATCRRPAGRRRRVARAAGRHPRASTPRARPQRRSERGSGSQTASTAPRSLARLLPARDPAQPPARLPPRADGARPRRTGCSTRRETGRSRAGTGSSGAWRAWHFGRSALRAACPTRADAPSSAARSCCRTCSRAPSCRSSSRRGACVPDRRARRELGPHRRQGSDRAVLRRVHRPEPDDGGRSRPLPRHLPGADRRHRLAADGRLSDRRSPARGLRLRSSGLVRSRSGAAARGRHGEHADERAVRGSLRRAARAWWEAEGRGSHLAPVPAASPRPRVARALRVPRSRPTGVHVQEASFTDLDVLATILQHAACVVANAGTILLEAIVNDRPAVCVLYDEGAPRGRELGAEERHRRALPRARDLRRRSIERSASRTSSRASSARSRIPTSSRLSGSVLPRSSVTSTGAPPSASWRQSRASWARPRREERGEPEKHERRCDGQHEAEVGEEPERVEQETTPSAASVNAMSAAAPRGRRTASATSTDRIHIHGRGYQRES